MVSLCADTNDLSDSFLVYVCLQVFQHIFERVQPFGSPFPPQEKNKKEMATIYLTSVTNVKLVHSQK